ncbi:MAG: hypothetical protein BGO78_17570 [Chloroflexi bacterium 44-23]|nr:MAG: hypothetical protein BGO78_17570 [Chloroflexi bacterium 44-23]
MISLSVIFWMYVILFGLIGAMRGWARELLVTFSVILALFIISVLEKFVPFVRDTLPFDSPTSIFWLRTGLIVLLVLFGYQTPKFPKIASSGRFVREAFQDILLGLFLGAINGYFIFGSLWYYLSDAGYPFAIISAPDYTTEIGIAAEKLLTFMPPVLLGAPVIYFAVAVAFVFVLVVFL